jgi:hypothetical protein
VEKQAKEPEVWLATNGMTEQEKETYLAVNDLQGLSLAFTDFVDFFEMRKSRMLAKLTSLLSQ